MNQKERDFVKTVWKHYKRHGRRSLPWRLTKNPYRILVSEMMLQQTQADRVIPKYASFLKRFPTITKLAAASLGDVLREWQGLGYNRRAKMLHECAKVIYQNRRVRSATPTLPKTYRELIELPGIGPYTAGAIMAFAYNEAVPIIETNIRTVFIHHFFHDEIDIPDATLFQSIERTLDKENPGEWYAALMDYGAQLKKTIGNQNIRSKHYTRQSSFKNSDRQIRGAILKLLTTQSLTRKSLHTELLFEKDRIDVQLEQLKKEGMIARQGQKYSLPR